MRLLTLTTPQLLLSSILRVQKNAKGLGCISSEVDYIFCQRLTVAFWLKNSHDVRRTHMMYVEWLWMTWLLKNLMWSYITTFFQSDSNFSLQIQASLILRSGGLFLLSAQGCEHCCQTRAVSTLRLPTERFLCQQFWLAMEKLRLLSGMSLRQIPEVTSCCCG